MRARPPFLQALDPLAPDFVEAVEQTQSIVTGPDSALDAKTRLLIALALDIAGGFRRGARDLANRARQAGATEAEIAAVVEICYVNGGLQRLSVGSEALTTDPTGEPDD
jgi:alkylhydroperoxidase/carboxymuconolactone decarboxylase family protein YurZ